MKPCNIIDLGLIDYKKALEYQRKLFKEKHANQIEDTLIIAEHFPVYTCGRSSNPDSLIKGKLAEGADLVIVDRGGSITYHGPGQLMIYPIIKMPQSMNVLSYIRHLESVAIRSLAVFGIKGTKNQASGVWAGKKKIASVGIKVSSGITMHGFSLNVSCDLRAFEPILPCGMQIKCTSMSDLLGYEVEINDVKDLIILNFGKILNYKLRPEEIAASLRSSQ